MLGNLERTVSIESLCLIADGLRSEKGENPEYDRALVEIVTEAAGFALGDDEGRGQIAQLMGITEVTQ